MRKIEFQRRKRLTREGGEKKGKTRQRKEGKKLKLEM